MKKYLMTQANVSFTEKPRMEQFEYTEENASVIENLLFDRLYANWLIESSASGEEREQPDFKAQQARFALFNQILDGDVIITKADQ